MRSELQQHYWDRRQFLGLGLAGAAVLMCPSHLGPTGQKRLFYSPEQSRKNLLVNIGDSIARGGAGKSPTSPADLIALEINSQPDRSWEVLNLAQVGVTTKEVIKHQLLDPNLKAVMEDPVVVNADFIVHMGVNDIGKRFAGDEAKINRMKSQLADMDINAIRMALSELGEATAGFAEDFKDFLEAAEILFGKKIRHLIVISPPDFSLAPSINSYANGRVYSFSLDNPLIQILVREGCNRLRGKINDLVRGYSPFPSLTVSTENLNRSHFIGDQHLNEEGNLLIARNFLSRIVL